MADEKEFCPRRRKSSPVWLGRPRFLLVLVCASLLLAGGSVRAGRRLSAFHYLRVGRDYLARYRPEQARPHLEACLRLWPENSEALLLLARAARRADALASADQYLREYRRIHGEDYSLILEELLQIAAKGETDRVVESCRHLVREGQENSHLVLEAMVQGYLRAFRFSEGFACLQRWLDRQPDNTQALVFLAGLHAVMQRHKEAAETYGRILELDPEHVMARLRLAMILMDDKRYEEAILHLQQLRERHADSPIMPRVLVLLARSLEQTGHDEAAEQLREKVLARNPRYGPAIGDCGKYALRQGRWADAERLLREALADEPNNCDFRYQLVQCLFKSGQSSEADAELQQLKRIEAGLKRFEEIVQHELPQRPRDPALHSELGRLLVEQGQMEQGVYWLHRVLQAYPADGVAHRTLADYYQQVGDTRQAAYHRRF